MKKVLIVGLGSIGLEYDLKLDPTNYIYTHSRSFAKSKFFDLVGAIDTDPKKRKIFSQHYSCPTFSSIKTASENVNPDLVVISVPTKMHLQIVEEVILAFKPRAILLEKPISYDLNQSIEIAEMCLNNKIDLFVNFYRRSDPGVLKVKSMLNEMSITKPFKGILWYPKGFIHNGSHFINLFEFWFGKIKKTELINVTRSGDDYSLDACISFQDLKIYFLHFENESYTHHFFELFSHEGKIVAEQGRNLYFYRAGENPELPGYKMLKNKGVDLGSDINKYQFNVAIELENYFNKLPFNLCTGEEAIQNQKSIFEILKNL